MTRPFESHDRKWIGLRNISSAQKAIDQNLKSKNIKLYSNDLTTFTSLDQLGVRLTPSKQKTNYSDFFGNNLSSFKYSLDDISSTGLIGNLQVVYNASEIVVVKNKDTFETLDIDLLKTEAINDSSIDITNLIKPVDPKISQIFDNTFEIRVSSITLDTKITSSELVGVVRLDPDSGDFEIDPILLGQILANKSEVKAYLAKNPDQSIDHLSLEILENFNTRDLIALKQNGISPQPTKTEVEMTEAAERAKLSQKNQDITEQLKNNVGQKATGLSAVGLDNNNLLINVNPDQSFEMASVFKIFVVTAILNKVELGKISLSDQLLPGLTVKSCIERLILISANGCARELIAAYGGDDTLNEFLNANNLKNTSYHGLAKFSTASDTARLFSLIDGQKIVNKEHKEYIIDMLKRQIHRYGLGITIKHTIANKLGWIPNKHNDCGIIYNPKNKYVLCIYTNGQSFYSLAALAKQIDDYIISTY